MKASTAGLLLASCAWTTVASAQEVSVELHASTSASLGVPVKIEASARLTPELTLALDLQRSATESFAITSVREIPEPASGPAPAVSEVPPVPAGRISLRPAPQRRFELMVVPLDVGKRVFPLYWTVSGSGSSATISSSLALEVREPPEAAESQDVKDIKPPRSARPLLWPFLLIAALVLAVWYWDIWRAKRRRGLDVLAGPAADTRPPEIIAEEELARLESSGLWAEGRHKDFYGALTDILRRYMERRQAFPATRETTAEIYRRLRRLDLDRSLLTVFKDLFERADLVKFAKIPAQARWGASDLTAARRLVRETTPPEAAAPAPQEVRR